MNIHMPQERLFTLALLLAVLLWATMHAQTSGPQLLPSNAGPLGTEFAYVANAGSSNLSVYAINGTTGALIPVAGSPFPTGSFPQSVAIDPLARFAYVANYGSDNISAYAIDKSTGGLKQISGSPFAGGSGPSSVTVDPKGRFAYVTNILSKSISAYAIDSLTGVLTEIAGSPFPTESGPISIALDPSGRYAYVANYQSNNISGFSVQAVDGTLVPLSGSPFAAGIEPFSVTVHPSGKFVYAANNRGNVSAYAVDSATGALTPIAGSPFPVGDWAVPVTVDPSGRFAYAGGGSDGTFDTAGYIAGFAIDPTSGVLNGIPGSPFAAGIAPWSVAIDPSDQFVYVTNQFITSNDVSAYAMNASTGALTPIQGSPFLAGSNPHSVAVIIARYATSTSLTSSLNPSIYGQKVAWTVTATSSGSITPTGKVRFTWSDFTIGSATLNSSGLVTFSRSDLNADPYPLTAVYGGDANNLPSTSTILNQVVLQTTSTASLTSSPNPSTLGQAVTFRATISSPTVMPKGPVTFTSGKTVLGTAQLSSGKAQLVISSLPVGSSKVTVTFYGNSNIAKSSASVTQTVR